MTKTKFVAKNANAEIQFLNLLDRDTFMANNSGFTASQFDEEISDEQIELTKEDWLQLEQALYSNRIIFGKVYYSEGNGFALISKIFTDGKTTFASENALLDAINRLVMSVPYTDEEKNFINQCFEDSNFRIRL